MKDPAVRQTGGMALNLEIRTERLTNSRRVDVRDVVQPA